MNLKIETGVPYPKSKQKELTKLLTTMQDGEYLKVKYEDFSKSAVRLAITSARAKLFKTNISLKTLSTSEHMQIWSFKQNKKTKHEKTISKKTD